MSTHIAAEPGQIASRVLLPGDPLRARWIAETFLEDAACYSSVRNMLGYTGTFRGERISVQGTGMGQPSLAIYVTELIQEYGAEQLVRVGSCGSLVDDLALRDVVLAISASSDSSMNTLRFSGLHYSPTADFDLLRAAYDAAARCGTDVTVGQIFSSDSFYSDRPELLAALTGYGVIAVEMECHALYTLAAKHGRRALTVCTVSDHIPTGGQTTAEERERTFGAMVDIALDAMLAVPLPGLTSATPDSSDPARGFSAGTIRTNPPPPDSSDPARGSPQASYGRTRRPPATTGRKGEEPPNLRLPHSPDVRAQPGLVGRCT